MLLQFFLGSLTAVHPLVMLDTFRKNFSINNEKCFCRIHFRPLFVVIINVGKDMEFELRLYGRFHILFFFFVMTKDLLFCYFYSCESLLLSCIILLDFIEIMCVCARVYVYIWRYIPLVILSWSWFHSLAISTSQAIRIKYLHPDSELQNYALQVMEMLRAETSVDAHALVFFSIICSFYLFYDVHFIEIKWQR